LDFSYYLRVLYQSTLIYDWAVRFILIIFTILQIMFIIWKIFSSINLIEVFNILIDFNFSLNLLFIFDILGYSYKFLIIITSINFIQTFEFMHYYRARGYINIFIRWNSLKMIFICERIDICERSSCIWKSWVKCLQRLCLNVFQRASLISFHWFMILILRLRIRSTFNHFFGLTEFNALEFIRKVIWEWVHI
jgi:hypothetical protein